MFTNNIIKLIDNNTTIFDYTDKTISNQQLEIFRDALKYNHTLEKIKFCNVFIDDTNLFCNIILDYIKVNTNLKKVLINNSTNLINLLNQKYIFIRNANYFDKNLNIYINYLKILFTFVKNNNIELFQLKDSNIINNNDLFHLIFDFLKTKTNLEKLALINDNIVDSKMICKIIKNLKNLKILNLNNNKINQLEPFEKVLKNNTKLKELYLNNNKIENIEPLCKTLKENNCLEYLDLSNNNIKKLGLLFEVLQNKKTFKKLEIDYEQINDFNLLNDLLVKNNSIEVVVNVLNLEQKKELKFFIPKYNEYHLTINCRILKCQKKKKK